MSALAVTGLTLRLGGQTVLDAVDIGFAPGRVTAVLGPNGAGKSSLLACLAGLIVPDAGRVLLDGAPLAALSGPERARRIGLLPQAGEVHWDIDVRALVGLGRLPHHGRWGATEKDHAAVARAMVATDVVHLERRIARRLSGGELARVLLARVLAGEPQWLLADEPLASLDPAHQIDVLDRLRDAAAGGAGVVIVLHDLNLAARIADSIVLLGAGRVLAAGTPDAVMTAETLGRAYAVRVHVGTGPDGRPLVLPLARLNPK